MKKLLTALIAAITLATTLPVLAGPDWQAIEHARKAKQQAQMARPDEAYEAMAPTGAGPAKCPPQALVLPLDHGPRALTTPYQNRLRKEQHEAQVQACNAPTK